MGRMSTDDTIVDTVQAARKMNFAYSIDPYQGDTDTFTAVDDCKQMVDEPDFVRFFDKNETSKGSAHFDEADIASNVFYGYLSICTRTLLENKLRAVPVDDKNLINKAIRESREIIRNFIVDYICLHPEAKQTTHASMSRPLAIFITAGTRVQGLTADNYFEKAVRATDSKSVGEIGVERLRKFAEDSLNGSFVVDDNYQGAYWVSDLYNEDIPENVTETKLKAALDEIMSIVGDC